MKRFKVVGKNKKAVILVEEFLEKINFEEAIKEMISESELYWIPWEETQALKNFRRAIKRGW